MTPIVSQSRAVPRRAATRRHLGSWIVVAVCSAGALALAAHHPLAAPAAVVLAVVVAAAAWRWPTAWPALVPALLPLIGWAPWSGWFVAEELDIAVLALAAGGYAARASGRLPAAKSRPRALVGLTAALFGASLLAAMARGVADAGGWQAAWQGGWWQGYHEPLNSVRLAKGFLLAWLLRPLWTGACAARPEGAPRALATGLASGLVIVGLAVLGERLAFPGLLNFSTDYRVTAPFWEMHVGGAALDFFLALTLPFAAALLMRAPSAPRAALGAVALALGIYASAATFSRVLLVAAPLGIAVTLLLGGRAGGVRLALGRAGLLLALFTALAMVVFGSGGYRVMLALLGAAVLLLRLAPQPGRVALGPALMGLAGVGLLLAFVPKGAYIGYTLAWLASAAALALRRTDVAAAAFIGVVTAALGVAWHWGGEAAALQMAPAALLLLATLVIARRRAAPPWPPTLRWQTAVASAMAGCALLVGVFGGGAYMRERLGSAEGDVELRLEHWRGTLALLDGADWLIGAGLGRFPDRMRLAPPTLDYQTGDARWLAGGPGPHVVLTGGAHEIDWGQILRLTQRVAAPSGAVEVTFDALVTQPVGVHLEVCEKQLLYTAACLYANADLAPAAGWQHVRVALAGGTPSRGSWWAPRPIVFSVGVLTRKGRVEIDNLRATDAAGRSLLDNGNFDRGLAHWMLSSDRHHMPWHEKNLPLHVLFGQGVLGLGLLLALAGGALWRVSVGHLRGHPLAPPLAGALVATCGVGAIDSLLDAPRLAFLFHLLVMVALTSPALPKAPPRATA